MRKPAAPAIDPAPIVYVIDDDPSVRAALADPLSHLGQPVQDFHSPPSFPEHDPASAPARPGLTGHTPGTRGTRRPRPDAM